MLGLGIETKAVSALTVFVSSWVNFQKVANAHPQATLSHHVILFSSRHTIWTVPNPEWWPLNNNEQCHHFQSHSHWTETFFYKDSPPSLKNLLPDPLPSLMTNTVHTHTSLCKQQYVASEGLCWSLDFDHYTLSNQSLDCTLLCLFMF